MTPRPTIEALRAPWFVEPDRRAIVDADGQPIALLATGIQADDARLTVLTAAPELVVALRELIASVEWLHLGDEDPRERILAKARAALDLAENHVVSRA